MGETITDVGRRTVESFQLGIRVEPAERELERDEEPFDRRGLVGCCATDDDLAAHGAKAGGAHDVCVDACGGLEPCDGATEPLWKNESDRLASCAIRDETSRAPARGNASPRFLRPPVWAPRTSTERTPNPATAAPADATLRNRARRRAGARREEEDTAPWKRTSLRATCDPGCARVKARRPGRGVGRRRVRVAPAHVRRAATLERRHGRPSGATRTRRRSGLRAERR